jgi:hypothetical protein
MSAAVSALRRQLEELVPTAPVETRGVGTGIAGVDALLPMRGLPRGKLTEIRGQKSSGIATVMRHIVANVSQNRLVAYVDAKRTLSANDWVTQDRAVPPIPDAPVPVPDHLWIIRPHVPADGPWCTDVLLRSGAFALVVLDGAPPLSRSVAARLIRLARETGTALVVAGETGEAGGVIGAAVRIAVGKRIHRGRGDSGVGIGNRREIGDSGFGSRARTRSSRQAVRAPHANSAVSHAPSPIPTPHLVITIEKGGIRRDVEVEYAIGVEDRLCAHPAVGDRRGAQSGNGNRESGIGGIGTAGPGDWGLGIGAESEFGSGQRSGTGNEGTGQGGTAREPGDARRAARTPAVPSGNPHPPLGPAPDRPRLRRRPRAAGVASGHPGGDPDGNDGDGGPGVMRGARGSAVG